MTLYALRDMSQDIPRQQGADKAVIHCDVDCFYCQVEVLDNPALAGRPLAVHQGNSGGFVAVNYKARAAGIRCGDGSDPHSLAARTFHCENVKSLPETQQLCPGLITKPMRSDRYRQVSAQILALISQHATNRQCEKTSYDDFYLEVVPADAQLSASDGWQPPDHSKMHILGDTSWAALPAVLKWAVQVACNIRGAIHQELGLTMSFGIAVGKLAARLAGPLHKPSGMTVVPPHKAAAFLLDTPILKVPHLRGQLGKQVVEQLAVEHVCDLAAFQAKELTDLFGTATGQLLFDLGHCIDDKRVQAKGPQQSICCTKSYHGLRDFARVDEALQRLVFALWPRLLEERSTSGRLPAKLKLSLKQGGREQQVRSYTLPFPQPAANQLQATALGSVDASACQSSAVHTLIPNLAPRSRLQHSSLGRGRDRGRGPSQHRQCCSAPQDSGQLGDGHTQLHGQLPEDSALQASAGVLATWEGSAQGGSLIHTGSAEGAVEGAVDGAADSQLPAAGSSAAQPGGNQLESHEWLESGVHQAARGAIFQAAMGLLKPKLAQPVLVNFMSVAGEYAKEARQQLDSNQSGMLRFLQQGNSCASAESVSQKGRKEVETMDVSHVSQKPPGSPEEQLLVDTQSANNITQSLGDQSCREFRVHSARPDDQSQKRTTHLGASEQCQQRTSASQGCSKRPKRVAGPMDRFLSKH